MEKDALEWLKKHIATLDEIRNELMRLGIDPGKMQHRRISHLYQYPDIVTSDDPSAYRLILAFSHRSAGTFENSLLLLFDPASSGILLENILNDAMVETWHVTCHYDTTRKSGGQTCPLTPAMQEMFDLKDGNIRQLTREQGLEAVRTIAKFFLRARAEAAASSP